MRRPSVSVALALSGFLLATPMASLATSGGVLSVNGGSRAMIVIDAPVPVPDAFILIGATAVGHCYRWSGQAVVHSNVPYNLRVALAVPSDAAGRLHLQLPPGMDCAVMAGGTTEPGGGVPVSAGQLPTAARLADVTVDILVPPDADVATTLAGISLAIWATAAT
jgi:hypothetical protein